MNRLQRRRRTNLTTLPGLVAAGRLLPVQPTTDTGYKLYGAGRLFLPAGTNLATDPQGTAQTFWPADGTHNDLTPNQSLPVPLADQPLITKCIKLANDGTAESSQTANMTVSASTSYWTTLYVYAPTLGGNLVITGETGTTSTVATLTAANTGWVRYAAATNTGVGQTTLALKFAFAGGTASTVYVTGVCPYAGTVTVPYWDGSYPGCAWSGTANASTSTRSASDLQFSRTSPFTLFTQAAGTWACRFAPLFASSASPSNIPLLGISRSGTPSMCIRLTANANNIGLVQYDGASFQGNTAATSYTAGSLNSAVGRWGGGKIDTDVNGTGATQADLTITPTPDTDMRIGGNDGSEGASRSYVGPVVLSPTRWSDADKTSFQANQAALWSDVAALYNWLKDHGYANSLILPLQSDSVGYIVRS